MKVNLVSMMIYALGTIPVPLLIGMRNGDSTNQIVVRCIITTAISFLLLIGFAILKLWLSGPSRATGRTLRNHDSE